MGTRISKSGFLYEWTFPESSASTYLDSDLFQRKERLLGKSSNSHLDIYLKPDTKLFTVKVMINKDKSYLSQLENRNATMKHEIYRANLAALVAKKTNEFIAKNKIKDENKFLKLFKEYELKFNRLDKLYKEETGFSTNVEMQDYWEYKIDSMYFADYELKKVSGAILFNV